MSAQCEITAKQAVGAPMSIFERYLPALCWANSCPGFFRLSAEWNWRMSTCRSVC